VARVLYIVARDQPESLTRQVRRGADLSHGLVMEVPRIEDQSSQRSAACSILQIQPAI
jgi:hypothetical protein